MPADPPAPLDIRPATPADVPAIAAMIRELAAFEQLGHLVAFTDESLAAALFEAASPVEFFVGRCDDAPVAYSAYFQTFSTFLGRKGLYLEDLYVRPAFRRRGYGRAMLLHGATLAKTRGCGRFEWMALDWNAPAIRFYEGLGASQLPEWRLFRATGDALAQMGKRPKAG